MFATFTESVVEEAALSWFGELGYSILAGPEIAPGELLAERDAFSDVILTKRLQAALYSLNPKIPTEAIDEALRKLTRPEAPSLIASNRAFHRMLIDGIPVEYRQPSSPTLLPEGEGSKPAISFSTASVSLSIRSLLNLKTRKPCAIMYASRS